jgi:hypothetical protein
MQVHCLRSTLSLAESMVAIAILGVGLTLPSAVSTPVAMISAPWFIASYLPPRGAKAVMIVLGVVVVGLLVLSLFPVGLIPLRGPYGPLPAPDGQGR